MTSVGTGRSPEIDVVKAASIVAVIIIHSLRPFWLPDVSGFERMVLLATRFGVPAFLAASGFLYYSREPIPWTVIRGRLRRVVIPYCVVSAAAAGYGLIHPERLTADSLISGLLLGALFGPYYYVFLLVGFIFLTWVLSRLPATFVTWLAVVSLGTVLLWESRTPAMWKPFSSLWAVRNPLLWTGWCLLGWTVAAHRGAVFGRIARHRTAIMGGCAAYAMLWAVGFAGGALTGRPARACVVLLIFTTIAGLVAVGSRIRVSPPWLEELSDWTYSLYLWHPFFIYYVQDVVVPALGLPAAVWVPLSAVVGFLGALAVTVTGRRVLGAWSRDIIGS